MRTTTIPQSSNFAIFKQMIRTQWPFAVMTVAKVAILYIVALVIVGPNQASLIFISILFSAAADLIGGWRMGLACIPTFAIIAFIAKIAGSDALMAAIWVGLMAAILGVAAVRGYHNALIGLPIISSVIVTQSSYIYEATEVIFAVAMGAALGLLVRIIPPRISLPPSPRLATEAAAFYAAILFAFTFATVYLTVAFNLPHGYWLTVTVLAVIQPDIAKTRNRVATRITGTILGAIAAVIVVDFVKNPIALIVLTLIIMIVLVSTLGGPYHYTAALITASIILISAAITGGASIATYRIGFTIAAGLSVGVFAYLIDPWLRPVDMRQV